MKKEIIFLLSVFFLAAFLRFYKLSDIPLGLYVDEASIGYNSYSILKTGKDEYGKSFPVYFRSFGDYKMPLYIYLSTVPIKIFGLSIFSVRFLSALSGSLTIFIVYLLAKNLFPKERKLAPVFVILFSILPWTIFLSRMALEMQLGLFFFFSAVLLHQKALKDFQIKWWLLMVFLYSLSAYSYHTEKFIAPLMFVLWSFLNYPRNGGERTKKWWKCFILAGILFGILLWPQVRLSFSSGANTRIRNLSYLEDKNKIPSSNLPLAGLRKWGAMYTSYYSPRNLFYNPDPDPQRSLPQLSVFYSWMIVFFLIGIYCFLKKKDDITGKKMTLLLLFLSPLPASLTADPFSIFRPFPLVFPLTIFISLGITKTMVKIKRRYFILGAIIVLVGSLCFLWRSLFVLLPNERFTAWKYGYAELVQKINKGNYPKILIDDTVGTSYTEILFFNKFDPSSLQRERKIDLAKYYQLTQWEGRQSWSNYQTRPLFWKNDVFEEQLIVATPLAISEDQVKEHFLTKAFDIIGPDGKIIFNAYSTSPELKRLDDEKKSKLK